MPSRAQAGARASRTSAKNGAGKNDNYVAMQPRDTQALQSRTIGQARPSQTIAPPPGLGCTGDMAAINRGTASETHYSFKGADFAVELNGLPNAMLTDVTMDAMLEQAFLEDHVAGIEMKHGKPCGSAKISFKTQDAADRCVRHFDGRCWDPSGTVVSATLNSNKLCVLDGDSELHRMTSSMPCLLANARSVGARPGMPSVDMPAYVHINWCTTSFDKMSVMSTPRTVDVISSSDESAEVCESDTTE